MQDQATEIVQDEATTSWALDLFHDLAGLASGITGSEDPTILGYLIVLAVLTAGGLFGLPMVLGFITERTIKLPFRALSFTRRAAAEARLESRQSLARQAEALREKAFNLDNIVRESEKSKKA